MEEKRYFSRIKFACSAQLETDGARYDAELLDICLKGALLRSEESLALMKGDACVIRIFLPSSAVTLIFNAQVAHSSGNYFGFRFLEMDAETLTHLRKLLETNLGDPEKIRDELRFWLK